jgi:hypothetical protein
MPHHASRMYHFRYFLTEITSKLHLHEPIDEIRDFDVRHRGILRKHIAVLGWWSLLNIVLGIAALIWLSGHWYYFMMMNMVWGIINFMVSMIVIDHAFFRKFRKGDCLERFEVQRHIEKMLIFNIGLDLSYIFFGLFLHAKGCAMPADRIALWQGFGISVIAQGIFLFGLDNYFHYLHLLNFRKAQPYLEKVLWEGEAVVKESEKGID